MATITVRRLDTSNGQNDSVRGNGLADFLTDIDAVAQIIRTRLLLFTGEWWEALNVGLPLFQGILGVPSTSQAVALLIRARILGTPFVKSVANIVIDYTPAGRAYSFSAVVVTQFGLIQITGMPLPGADAIVSN